MDRFKELDKVTIPCRGENDHLPIDEELERILDECIEKATENHDFEEYKKMSQKEVNEIMKELLSTKREVLTNRSVSMDSEGKILKVAERNNEGIKNIETKYNKTTFALFATFFLLGTLVGLQDEFWKPYLSDIINGAKAFATWGR